MLNAISVLKERESRLGETRKATIDSEVESRMEAKYPKIKVTYQNVDFTTAGQYGEIWDRIIIKKSTRDGPGDGDIRRRLQRAVPPAKQNDHLLRRPAGDDEIVRRAVSDPGT